MSNPLAGDGAVSRKGWVLLLDDDDSFREIITDCLIEYGYAVVAVDNGGDGVREVLTGDFALVLCDLVMPCLAGDMFYRAVERIRPSLCQRFVFMTGHQSNPATDAFIKSVDGFVLRKPFPLKNLLDAIAFVECRLTFQSVCTGPVTEVNPLPGSESASRFREGSAPVAETAAVERILARARKNLPAPSPSDASSANKPQLREGGMSRACVFEAVALMLVVAGGLWIGNLIARDRLDSSAVKRRALESEWAAVSPDLQEALAKRSKAAASEQQLARLAAHRAKPRWASVLRCILPPGGAMIEILGVDARPDAKDLGACEVNIRGIADGRWPRQMAEQFRQSVEDNLRRDASGRAVTARFEGLVDAPGVLPDQKRVEFVMIVTLGSIEPLVAMRKEGL